MKTLAAGTIAIALLAPAAFAEPGKGDRDGKGKGRPDGKGRPSHEEILKKFDKDGDGKLSEDERVTMFRARLEKSEKFKEMITKRADKDGDGELSDDEIKAAMKRFRERAGRGPGDRDGKKPRRKPHGDRPDGDAPKKDKGSKKDKG